MEDTFWIDFAVVVGRCVFAVAFVMNIVPLLIWGERKGAAYIQDRPGPNRAPLPLPHPLDTPKVLFQLLFGQSPKFKPYVMVRAAGLVHTLNDVVKLAFKEDIAPGHVEKFYWFIAPVIAMTIALCTFAVVPFGDSFLGYNLQVSSMDGGLLFVLAMTSLGVYGIMLAGWSSNNRFSLLGGLRSSAQMVSYELAMGLSAVVVFLSAGSVSLAEISQQQAGPIWNWNVFSPFGALAFILFWVSAFAETNRTPFDLPEGEAELVAGYHTEYSSFRFALFFMAEYANMIVAAAVTATLFFGGYNVPFITGQMLREHADLLVMLAGFGAVPAFLTFAVIAIKRQSRPFYQSIPKDDPRQREPLFFASVWGGAAVAHLGLGLLGALGMISGPLGVEINGTHLGPEVVAFVAQLTALSVKVLIGCWIFIWVRWTLPRFRYDQLMNLGWRYMLPLSLANVFGAAAWIIVKQALFA
ncbi:MAG: NADH-quinone oxidoreductase subunit H [Deltaproteobacteria bacterium]|nr:NADH-quinone oxidoreductase subunit H [Deltaproteobacteria bacterium]